MSNETEGTREHIYPRFELLLPEMLERVAKVMTEGATKYGDFNWQKFNSDQIKDIPRHAFMHIISYMQGDTTEDHLANCICNCMMAMYYQEDGITVNLPSEESIRSELKSLGNPNIP